MKPKTKLEIIGPYTADHEGPVAWVLGYPKKCLVHDIVDGVAFITADGQEKPFSTNACFIRSAREVPVAQEFWVNEYHGDDISYAWGNEIAARTAGRVSDNYLRTIHVREVLPGDGE